MRGTEGGSSSGEEKKQVIVIIFVFGNFHKFPQKVVDDCAKAFYGALKYYRVSVV